MGKLDVDHFMTLDGVVRKFFATRALAAPMTLRVGERAPDFSAPDQDARTVKLADYRGRWLVLYFYPKDETPGCIVESCAFRDRYEAFLARGIAVVGVSRDSVESHRAFATARALPFPLLSDPAGAIVEAYGAMGLLGLPKRVTFLIDADGVLRETYDSHLRPGNHVAEMLAAHARLA